MLNSVGEETRTGRMQADLGLDVHSTGRMQFTKTKYTGQDRSRPGRMQDRADAGQD